MKKLLIGFLILINIMVAIPVMAQSSLPATNVRTSDGSNVQLKINALVQSASTNTSDISLIHSNLDTHETYIQALKLNLDTHELLLVALGLNIGTHESAINAKLNITAFTTHENLLTAHGLPSRVGNGAKYLYLSTDENTLMYSALTMPDLSPYAIKATTDSLEINFLAHKDATASAHPASAISVSGTAEVVLGTTDAQSTFDTIAVAIQGGNTGEVWTKTLSGYIWATIPAGVTDHTLLTSIGTLTHAQIDSAIAALQLNPGGLTGMSVNGGTAFTGEVKLVAGTNVTLTQTGNTVEVSATGGSGTGAAVESILNQTYTNRLQGSGAVGYFRIFQYNALYNNIVTGSVSITDNGLEKYLTNDFLIGTWSDSGQDKLQITTLYDIDTTSEIRASYYLTAPSFETSSVLFVRHEGYSSREQGGGSVGTYRTFKYNTLPYQGVITNSVIAIVNGLEQKYGTDYTTQGYLVGDTYYLEIDFLADVTSSANVYINCLRMVTGVPTANQIQLIPSRLGASNLQTLADTLETNMPTNSGIASAISVAVASATAECQAKTWYPLNMAYNDYTGEVIVDGMAASATVGQCLYLTSGGWTIAKADAIGTLPAYGLCVETGTGNRKVLTRGIVRSSGWSFTKGNRIYVSPSTGGAITATRPSTGGQFIQAIGVALSSDTVYFKFDDTVAGL